MRYFRIILLIVTLSVLLCSCASAGNSDNDYELIASGKGSIAAVNVYADAQNSDLFDENAVYVLNTNTKVIHKDINCTSVLTMSDKNKKEIEPADAYKYLASGYHFCSVCSVD